MSKVEIIIALGGNLGEREKTLARAVEAICQRIGEVTSCSKFIETEPLVLPGREALSQPNYLNGVLICTTERKPEEVLEILLDIERSLGRKRGVTDIKWGARTIDLDLIAAGNIVLSSKTLTIPHPEMHKRRFVLEPLAEIAPKWVHPVLKRSVRELLEDLG